MKFLKVILLKKNIRFTNKSSFTKDNKDQAYTLINININKNNKVTTRKT